MESNQVLKDTPSTNVLPGNNSDTVAKSQQKIQSKKVKDDDRKSKVKGGNKKKYRQRGGGRKRNRKKNKQRIWSQGKRHKKKQKKLNSKPIEPSLADLAEIFGTMSGLGGGPMPFNRADYINGFSPADVEELFCQGVKPWDSDAADVLAVLNGEY